jgi:hypothetical protein
MVTKRRLLMGKQSKEKRRQVVSQTSKRNKRDSQVKNVPSFSNGSPSPRREPPGAPVAELADRVELVQATGGGFRENGGPNIQLTVEVQPQAKQAKSTSKYTIWSALIALIGTLFIGVSTLWQKIAKDNLELEALQVKQYSCLQHVKAEVIENVRKLETVKSLNQLEKMDPTQTYLNNVSLGRLRVVFNLCRFRNTAWIQAKSVEGVLEKTPAIWGEIETFYFKVENASRSLEDLLVLWEQNSLRVGQETSTERSQRAKDVSEVLAIAFPRILEEIDCIQLASLRLCDSIDLAILVCAGAHRPNVVLKACFVDSLAGVNTGTRNLPVSSPNSIDSIRISRLTIVLDTTQFFRSPDTVYQFENTTYPHVLNLSPGVPAVVTQGAIAAGPYNCVLLKAPILGAREMKHFDWLPDTLYKANVVVTGGVKAGKGKWLPFVFKTLVDASKWCRVLSKPHADFDVIKGQPATTYWISLEPSEWFWDLSHSTILDPTQDANKTAITLSIERFLRSMSGGRDRESDGEIDLWP